MQQTLLTSALVFSLFAGRLQDADESVPTTRSAAPNFDIMKAQRENGSWSAQDVPKGLAGIHPGTAADDLWVTSSVLLAILGDGITGRNAPYNETVRPALTWIESLQKEDGRLVSPGAKTDLLVHSFATLVLTEHQFLIRKAENASAASRAVQYLESRAIESGGWNRQGAAVGAPDPRTTAWACMAIRSARDCGFASENKRLKDAAASLIRHNTNLAQPTAMARSCELLARLLSGESPEAESFVAATSLLLAQPLALGADGVGHNPEEILLRSIVAFRSGGDTWKAWRKRVRSLVKRCTSERSGYIEYLVCDPKLTYGGSIAACGFTILTLATYYRYTVIVGLR